MTKTKVVILGGGPSGLGVAWGLKDFGDCQVRLVEKADRLGGLSGSFEWESSVLDFGPHRFSPEFPEFIDYFKERMGEDLLKIKNEHAVVFRGRTYRYPPQVKDFLNLDSVKFSFQVLGSMIREVLSPSLVQDSFQSRVIRSFGSTLFHEVVSPLSHKVWGDPVDFHPDFAGIRFSVPTVKQWAKKWLKLAKANQDEFFYYPKNGFSQLWDVLAADLRDGGVEISTKSEVSEIQVERDKVVAVKINNQWESCDYLVSTIPLEKLLLLMEQRETYFETRGMLLIHFLIAKGKVLPARVVIFPESDYVFNRLCEPSQFSLRGADSGKTILQADVTKDVAGRSDAQWIELVKEQLVSLKLINPNEILKAEVLRLQAAYPIPSKIREHSQAQWQQDSPWQNVFSTGRFASSDYNNSHTALFKGRELARFILGGQSPTRWYQHAESLRKIPVRD